MIKRHVVVVGGGAAGILAAGTAARQEGCQVTLVEKNRLLGKKLLITGKGRCNVTNACQPDEFFKNIVRNPKYLMSSFHAFTNTNLMELLEGLGTPLKIERGERVFPVSDRSADILAALKRYLKQPNVTILQDVVRKVCVVQGVVAGIELGDGSFLACDSVILCTGGASYQQTGSTGDGYRFAKDAGHEVTPLHPSLVPMEVAGKTCASLMGLSLKNISIDLLDKQSGKIIYHDFGELLFTHFGLSGPVILSASSHMTQGQAQNRYAISIDLKPALDEQKLDLRLQRDFAQNTNRDFANSLGALLPRKLIPEVIRRSRIPGELKTNQITKEQRRALLQVLKHFTLDITKLRPLEEAIVTSGGVQVKEVDPKTMESKLVKGLYFAGELLDLDAYTGGFNLQIAFSTGYAAGIAQGGNSI